jgi:hypothetical protein
MKTEERPARRHVMNSINMGMVFALKKIAKILRGLAA